MGDPNGLTWVAFILAAGLILLVFLLLVAGRRRLTFGSGGTWASRQPVRCRTRCGSWSGPPYRPWGRLCCRATWKTGPGCRSG